MNADLNKSQLWEEISGLSHIGRSANDINQSLIAMGYDASMLEELLTASFMDKLIEKEESFADMQHLTENRAVELIEKSEKESLKQKGMKEQVKKQKIEETARQNEDYIKTENEKKRIDFEEKTIRGEYLIQEKEENERAKQQAEEDKQKENKQEEEMRLQDLIF